MQLSEKIEECDLQVLRHARLPEKVGFGDIMLPIMTRARFRDGQWQSHELLPYQALSISPSCKGLHYGQVIFEGLKAYANLQSGGAIVFRMKDHWARMNQSAQHLLMPSIPQALFEESIKALVSRAGTYIPAKKGDALYIRPFMFSSASGLGLANNNDFDLYFIASPSEAYFTEPLDVLIERDQHRAFKGGTGMIKMAGNYGQIFASGQRAQAAGCGLSLWLDGETGRYVDEFSAMNFFALVDGVLKTPPLKGTILPGVTRASVIDLARQHSVNAKPLQVQETDIEIDALLADIESGRCTEVFASGTGATITPIQHLKDADGRTYRLPTWELSSALKAQLQNIHHGISAPVAADWCTAIPFIGSWI